MHCKGCGKELADNSLFCKYCGCKVSDSVKVTLNNVINTDIAGITYGNVSNASTISGEVKFGAERGHGFAAERVNHLHDKLMGKDALLVGDDNIKNGAENLDPPPEIAQNPHEKHRSSEKDRRRERIHRKKF